MTTNVTQKLNPRTISIDETTIPIKALISALEMMKEVSADPASAISTADVADFVRCYNICKWLRESLTVKQMLLLKPLFGVLCNGLDEQPQ